MVACSGGCVGGGGKVRLKIASLSERRKSRIYTSDRKRPCAKIT